MTLLITYFALLGLIPHIWMGVTVAADWDHGLTPAERAALYAGCIIRIGSADLGRC